MSTKIKNNASEYHYFFVKPNRLGSVHDAAKKLMKVRQVREVVITEGEYGFVVKATTAMGKSEADSVSKEISGITGGRPAKAACYCEYRKR